jgi:hypothetical protein
MGQEASEIDYFLHNIKEGEYLKKTVLQNLPENTSDHLLISLVHTFNFGFALKIALFDEEVIAADLMISQILSIDNGKPSEVENLHLQEKKKAKRHLRKTIRIEQAKQRNKEKELIMETKTKDMKLFHKLVRNNASL